jgi:hypothetical protein
VYGEDAAPGSRAGRLRSLPPFLHVLVRLAVGLTLNLKGVFHSLWVHDLAYATLHSFFMPIGWIVMTVLYLNVRIDREGCNREVLVRDLDSHGASTALDALGQPTRAAAGMPVSTRASPSCWRTKNVLFRSLDARD